MSMWGEALTMAVPVAVGMGLCGALLGLVLTGRRLPRPSASIAVIILTVLVIGGAVANGLRTEVPENANATVNLTDLPSNSGQRMEDADVQITLPTDQRGPRMGDDLAWQGGLATTRAVIERLGKEARDTAGRRVPIPVWGTWKTLLRVQDGTTMAAVPIFLPADPGIDAKEVPAQASSTRAFVQEITVLQRERNLDHPAWLFTVASLVVLVCTLVLIAALAWGAGRINSRELLTGSEPEHAPPRPVQPQT